MLYFFLFPPSSFNESDAEHVMGKLWNRSIKRMIKKLLATDFKNMPELWETMAKPK